MTDRRQAERRKRPASQFYWGDWLRSTDVRSLSIGARGLWIDLMCLMHEGEPYGHLAVAGKPLACEKAARMTGVSLGQFKKLLAEIEEAGVSSRTPPGFLYSRRMVKDEAIRNARAEGGKASANNPNVPRKKDIGKDGGEGYPPYPSLDPSPATASAVATAVMGEAQTIWEGKVGLVNRSLFRDAVSPVLDRYGSDLALKALRHYVNNGEKATFKSPKKFAQQAAACVDMVRPLTPEELAKELAR